MSEPVARSAIAPVPPTAVHAGWEVSTRASTAALVLSDVSPLAKVLVRAPERGATADALGVAAGRTRRDEHGLLVGSGPGEWLAIGPVGTAAAAVARLEALAAAGEHVSVVDQTHGRALLRLTGAAAADLLARVCAIDLGERATPDRTALRTSLAGLVTDLVRVDRDGTPSYLLHCERSSGQYLFDSLLAVGEEFDLDVTGFDDQP